MMKVFLGLVLLCILVWGSSADRLRAQSKNSKAVFGRKLGEGEMGKEELVELECPTDEACTVPTKVSLLNPQTMKALRSVKVEKIEDEVTVGAVEDSEGELPMFQRPTFKVTFKHKVIGLRVVSSSAVLVFRQQANNGEKHLPELYISRHKPTSGLSPTALISITQRLLALYEAALVDAARGSDDVFDSGALATYVFAPAVKYWKQTVMHTLKHLGEKGYRDSEGKWQKVQAADLDLAQHVPVELCDTFTEYQYWSSAIEEIFITSRSVKERDERVKKLFEVGAPDKLPEKWSLPAEFEPCRDDGEFAAGGIANVLSLRENGMLAPGESVVATNLVEAYETGALLPEILTAPLQSGPNRKLQPHETPPAASNLDDLDGGLMVSFVEKNAFLDDGKKKVGEIYNKGQAAVKNIHSQMQTDAGRKNLMDNAKKHLLTEKHQDNSKGFKIGMSYEQYQMGAGKGRHQVAYLNMDVMRGHDKKHKQLMEASKGFGRFSKEAKRLRNELVDLRDPLTGWHVDIDKMVKGNLKAGKASMARCGITLKRGAFKGGFTVTGQAQVMDIFQKDPETGKRNIKDKLSNLASIAPKASFLGFFSFDKVLKSGTKITCGVYVAKTVKAFGLGHSTEVRGQVDIRGKDGWWVSTKYGTETDGVTGEKTEFVKGKFRDTNAFGITGLLVDANLGFQVNRNAQGHIDLKKTLGNAKDSVQKMHQAWKEEGKSPIYVSYHPTFEPKWLKDYRNFQDMGTTSFTTFKQSAGANLAIEAYHKSTHQIRDWTNDVKQHWKSVKLGA